MNAFLSQPDTLSILFGVISIFVPGFLITCLLYDFGAISLTERVTLAIALSLTVIPLLMFYLSLFGLPISTDTILIGTLTVIIITFALLISKHLKNKHIP